MILRRAMTAAALLRVRRRARRASVTLRPEVALPTLGLRARL